MSIQSEIKEVLRAHAAWRERFQDVLNGRSKIDLSEIGATDKCFFGQWLDKEGKRMASPELHAEITAVHAEFHRIALDIIRKIKEKKFAEARKDISLDGELNKTSLRLKQLVVKMKFIKPAGEISSPLQDKQELEQ
jgi:hypothetical protein